MLYLFKEVNRPEELLYENAADFEIAKVLKKDTKLYFDTLEETFMTSGGKDFLVKHTKKIDTVLKLVYQVASRDMFGDYLPIKNSIPLALVALGSYGREQLFFHIRVLKSYLTFHVHTQT